MTDQDNLRNRIAEVIDVAADVWQNSKTDQRDELHAIAQAIIDELGLTVETVLSFDEIPEHLQGQFIDGEELMAWAEDKPKKSRIIGAWEWDNQ